MQNDYVTVGGQIIIALVGLVGVVLSALITQNTVQTNKARKASERAAELSEPTGNGFADSVNSRLEQLAADLGAHRLEQRYELRAVHSRIDSVHRRVNRLAEYHETETTP